MFTRTKSLDADLKKTYKWSQVIPVLKADTLFRSTRHQGLLRELQANISLSPDEYNRVYQETLNRFAEFVQVLPVTLNGALSGLLNEGLARSVIAVTHQLSGLPDPDPLFTYALFTATLFLDVAKAFIRYQVILSAEDGAFIDQWRPFEGSMIDKADFFKLYPLAPIYQRIERLLTPLLAQELMPPDCLSWIVSDFSLYADWLQALSGGTGEFGTLTHIISLLPRDDILNLVNSLGQVPFTFSEGQAYPYGELFYQWLVEGIASGDIAVNTADAAVHVVTEGVFLEQTRLADQFSKTLATSVNINAILAQFTALIGRMVSMGVVSTGPVNFLHAQYIAQHQSNMGSKNLAFSSPLVSNQRTAREGILVKNPAIIFATQTAIPGQSHLLKATQNYRAILNQLPAAAVQSPSQTFKNV